MLYKTTWPDGTPKSLNNAFTMTPRPAPEQKRRPVHVKSIKHAVKDILRVNGESTLGAVARRRDR